MRLMLVLLLCAASLAGCGVTTIEVNHYPNAGSTPTPGFYNDTQKWERVRDHVGRFEHLSRGEMLRGTSRYTADIVRGKLVAHTGYRDWVCRGLRQYDVLVIRCARHDKLQRYVRYNNEPAFDMQLQPALRWGAAPVYIDWGWR